MDAREKDFLKAMTELLERRKEVLGHPSTRVIQMVSNYGAVEAARRIINIPQDTTGLVELWEKRRLDLSIQTLVLRFPDLFTDEEMGKAQETLERLERK